MHSDEIAISVNLVQRLIVTQFPQWADMPITPAGSAGTSNVIYRLGDHFGVRLPRRPSSAAFLLKEQIWLPKLSVELPLPITTPIGLGQPTSEFPYPWSVFHWLSGDNPTKENVHDFEDAARSLGNFIVALQRIDTKNGPLAGSGNFGRGLPLQELDDVIHESLKDLHRDIDTHAAGRAWKEALAVPSWVSSPRWIHGDLHAGNLLAHNGKISAVIDFGGLGVGDPACDLMVAWTFLPTQVRQIFRETVGVDDDTWARGRGWALYLGLVALPYYRDSNKELASIARGAIDAVLEDVG